MVFVWCLAIKQFAIRPYAAVTEAIMSGTEASADAVPPVNLDVIHARLDHATGNASTPWTSEP